MRRSHLSAVFCLLLACGCATETADVVSLGFAAEQPLPVAGPHDTGLLPIESPAQVRIEALGDGTLLASAQAFSDGSGMLANAGSGALSIQPDWELSVSAALDVAGLTHRGPLGTLRLTPQMASASFDPFLLEGDEVQLSGQLVPVEFDALPIPATEGAEVVVELTEGSWSARFVGTCASTAGGLAQFRGALTFEGHLSFSVVVTADGLTVGPLALEVPLAQTTIGVDLGVRSLADGSEPTTGVAPCDVDRFDDPAPVDAGPMTCDGCIDDAGACAEGRAEDACGNGGRACNACLSGEVCADGICLESARCNPDNCDGCCEGEVCRTGRSGLACGGGGLVCEVCSESEVCFDGRCRRPCDAGCTGCCSGGACLDGNDIDSCGSAGAICEACREGESCEMGACVTDTCTESCPGCCAPGGRCVWPHAGACGAAGSVCLDCGPFAECVQGACVSTQASTTERWDVIIEEALVPAVDPSGSPWDSASDHPDPYVLATVLDPQLTLVMSAATTDPIEGELSPQWNHALNLSLSTEDFGFVNFQIFDADLRLSHQAMSTCSWRPSPAQFGSGPVQLSCPATHLRREAVLTVQLVPAGI